MYLSEIVCPVVLDVKTLDFEVLFMAAKEVRDSETNAFSRNRTGSGCQSDSSYVLNRKAIGCDMPPFVKAPSIGELMM